MAKVLGESGRYVTQEAVKKSCQTLLLFGIVMAILGFIEGFFVTSLFQVKSLPPWLRLGSSAVALCIVGLVFKWGNRRMRDLAKRREDMRRGATGEALVSQILADFPDDFYVINDLTTPFGNLDHVVVGSTGVFLLDTKSWRGVVSANGAGELLLNGQPTDKPQVRPFVRRIMDIRDKVATLAPGTDAYFNAVFVFTAARNEAKWGTTGNVHCVNDDKLHEYIVEKDFGKKLKPAEVARIAQAFLGLAHMDKDFHNPGDSRLGKETSARHSVAAQNPKVDTTRRGG
jgi:hypothetical protein